MCDIHSGLPLLFRPQRGSEKGQNRHPSDTTGKVPHAAPADGAQGSRLDWAKAMAMAGCLLCGWWGQRGEIDAHACHSPLATQNNRARPFSTPDLDSRSVCEAFGVPIPDVCTTPTATAALAEAMRYGKVDPADVTRLHHDVWAAVRMLECEITSGSLNREPRLVRGKPLADWLSLDDVARLLREARP